MAKLEIDVNICPLSLIAIPIICVALPVIIKACVS